MEARLEQAVVEEALVLDRLVPDEWAAPCAPVGAHLCSLRAVRFAREREPIAEGVVLALARHRAAEVVGALVAHCACGATLADAIVAHGVLPPRGVHLHTELGQLRVMHTRELHAEVGDVSLQVGSVVLLHVKVLRAVEPKHVHLFHWAQWAYCRRLLAELGSVEGAVWQAQDEAREVVVLHGLHAVLVDCDRARDGHLDRQDKVCLHAVAVDLLHDVEEHLNTSDAKVESVPIANTFQRLVVDLNVAHLLAQVLGCVEQCHVEGPRLVGESALVIQQLPAARTNDTLRAREIGLSIGSKGGGLDARHCEGLGNVVKAQRRRDGLRNE
mmetsp:Transcript_8389/g.35098  ORF Transcript_8389/g.35098 Transcript_8389/m.35098 type:complete len:328 (+) Transcript_8389:426-1409(+)